MKNKVSQETIEHFKYFANIECEYFPCHAQMEPSAFNCLFCFCPAYALGDQCGGNFSYDNEDGVKDCSDCTIPHHKDSYEFISGKAKLIVQNCKNK